MLIKICKYLLRGIAWGCTIFVFTCITGVLIAGNAFLEQMAEQFIMHAAGSIIVGICCASTAIVYTFERLSMWQCTCIHLGIGMAGYFAVAYKLRWMPIGSLVHAISFISVGLIFFLGIWTCFFLYYKNEAKKVNKRLKELENETDKT